MTNGVAIAGSVIAEISFQESLKFVSSSIIRTIIYCSVCFEIALFCWRLFDSSLSHNFQHLVQKTTRVLQTSLATTPILPAPRHLSTRLGDIFSVQPGLSFTATKFALVDAMAESEDTRPAIGIDLGTTNSRVGIWMEEENRFELISNDHGNQSTPSYVAFTETERLIGDSAKDQVSRNPANTIFGEFRVTLC